MLTVSRILRVTAQKHHGHCIASTVALNRRFHRSAILHQIPDNSACESSPTAKEAEQKDSSHPLSSTQNVEGNSNNAVESNEATTATTPKKHREIKETYGSAHRRAIRNKKSKELPPFVLPSWFYEKNVTLFDGQPEVVNSQSPAADTASDEVTAEAAAAAVAAQQELTAPEDEPGTKVEEGENAAPEDEEAEATAGMGADDTEEVEVEDPDTITDLSEGHYIDNALYKEILATLRATLYMAPPSNLEYRDILRNVTLLKCPKVEGHRFLDLTLRMVAKDLEADVLRIDAEDIALLVGGYLGQNVAWTAGGIGQLGYTTHTHTGKMEDFYEEAQEDMEEEEEDADEDNTAVDSTPRSARNKLHKMGSTLQAPRFNAQRLMDKLFGDKSGGPKPAAFIMGEFSPSSRADTPMPMEDFIEASANSGWQDPSSAGSDMRLDKIKVSLEAIVDVGREKIENIRNEEEPAATESSGKRQTSHKSSRPFIVQIAEYSELQRTPDGHKIIQKLKDIVKRRWYDGANVMIVGTSSIETDISANSSIRALQGERQADACRIIFVPPARTHTIEDVLEEDEKRYITNVNIRHVTDMILKLQPHCDVSAIDTGLWMWHLERKKGDSEESEVLSETILYPSTIQRIVMFMLGQDSKKMEFTNDDIRAAVEHLTTSDAYKFDWASKERNLTVEKSEPDTVEPTPVSEKDSTMKETARKMARIKREATKHEKKLLGGVVHPFTIRTSYADVRAPPATITALKSLTSLSLRHPEAFSYGILASEKIPGILLYGPPGTGKTLLAKAVAKESGATVLEVSGSEIYDMYVGEGEKNVKAVFTLAKKLSPCVIFIDEADAMFGARGGGDMGNRRSHRELINQFLKELDGMTSFAGILMVATNRPFDLDEAVLRRLPRRILIDLPLEGDREAILALQLREESLAEDVSLADLAKNTPLYSGSDLKNLAVAAALTAVREEVDAQDRSDAEKGTNESMTNEESATSVPYPKRILRNKHFQSALGEISASISEDMSTLQAIRKFDERYGDRKGRKKKGAGLGFGGIEGSENAEGEGRVRDGEKGVEIVKSEEKKP